jgi:monoamine oxidase
VCYANDLLADRLSALGEAERLRFAASELERVFPGAAANFTRGTSFSWKSQPWVRGGWPDVRGTFEAQLNIFREPEGQIYFAGDYATLPDYLNTVEGAIESGAHVASTILNEARERT